MAKPLIGRKIVCNRCCHKTIQGAARVRRKVLFFFCLKCWLTDRASCDAQMIAVTQ